MKRASLSSHEARHYEHLRDENSGGIALGAGCPYLLPDSNKKSTIKQTFSRSLVDSIL
jgi:hypothetical protein